jgi:putative transposase
MRGFLCQQICIKRPFPDIQTSADVLNYIEIFYNSKRRYGSNNQLSPVEYERRFTERLEGV